nr:MFS transporter [Georgenia sp. SYP-B2076]
MGACPEPGGLHVRHAGRSGGGVRRVGVAAPAFGYPVRLAASGLLLLLIPLSIAMWPLPATMGNLDRTIEPAKDALIDPQERADPCAGPVTVVTTYRVDAEHEADSVRAMAQVRLFRLRTGATSWRMTRSLEDPNVFTEVYTLPTWREHIRQERDRTTGEDRKLLARARDLARDEPVTSWHLPA